MTVLPPLALGGLAVVLLLSKLFDYIFRKAYAVMFHFILGVVIASTVLIIPWDYNYLSFGALICLFTCALGFFLGTWMSGLEKKYKS
jgi:putative membrane protein